MEPTGSPKGVNKAPKRVPKPGVPKSHQTVTKIEQQWHQNGTKNVPKRSQIGTRFSDSVSLFLAVLLLAFFYFSYHSLSLALVPGVSKCCLFYLFVFTTFRNSAHFTMSMICLWSSCFVYVFLVYKSILFDDFFVVFFQGGQKSAKGC